MAADSDQPGHPDDEGILTEMRAHQRTARRRGFYGHILLKIEYQDGSPAYREIDLLTRKNLARSGKRG